MDEINDQEAKKGWKQRMVTYRDQIPHPFNISINQSKNYSANQSIAPISPAQWRNSQISVQKQSWWSYSVASTGRWAHQSQRGGGGRTKPKRWVLRRLLKVATEVAERTDSGRLLRREGTQVLNALTSALVLILGTDRVIPLFDFSGRDGRDVESKQLR